jgi:hypothetical protein
MEMHNLQFAKSRVSQYVHELFNGDFVFTKLILRSRTLAPLPCILVLALLWTCSEKKEDVIQNPCFPVRVNTGHPPHRSTQLTFSPRDL